MSLLLAVIFRGTMLVEFHVVHRPHCSGLAEYILEPTPFFLSPFGLIWFTDSPPPLDASLEGG